MYVNFMLDSELHVFRVSLQAGCGCKSDTVLGPPT